MKKYILLVPVLLLLSFNNVYACKPNAEWQNITPQENFDKSEIVFVGKVSSVFQDKSIYGMYHIQFDVSKAYKGDLNNAVTVTTQSSSAACGFDNAYTTFSKGSIWAIYASKDLQTTSLSRNKEYKTVNEAMLELDALDGPKVCTMQYAPVCGRKDTGVRCVTTPCPSTEDKTYGNSCMLGADKAEFLYEGECKADTPTVTTPPSKPVVSENPQSIATTATTSLINQIEESKTWWENFFEKIKNVLFFWR